MERRCRLRMCLDPKRGSLRHLATLSMGLSLSPRKRIPVARRRRAFSSLLEANCCNHAHDYKIRPLGQGDSAMAEMAPCGWFTELSFARGMAIYVRPQGELDRQSSPTGRPLAAVGSPGLRACGTTVTIHTKRIVTTPSFSGLVRWQPAIYARPQDIRNGHYT